MRYIICNYALSNPITVGGGFGILSNAPTQNQKVGQLKCIITYIIYDWNKWTLKSVHPSFKNEITQYLIYVAVVH